VIHPSAIIDPAAQIGSNVSIGAFSLVGADVSIGDNSWIGPHVVISGPTRIGRENKIFQFSSIGEAPQDLKYNGEPTLLEIGDRNVIRENTTFHRGTVGGIGKTTIGNDNLFMAYTHVAHDCIIGDHVILANAASLAGHVEVGDYAILGGFTLVHQFTRIGQHSFCGLGSVVTQDITPFATVAGNRARAAGINKEGLKRRGFSAELIRALHKTFRHMVKSKLSREEALVEIHQLREEYPEVEYLVQFILNSKRGITR
jgi:UDP-N-acetylglucosamine acyltransferase